MFAKDNTQGFTTEQLNTLNTALADLIEAGIEQENASDLINNTYFEGATVTDLIKRHVRKSFYTVSGGVAEYCDHEGFDYEDNDSVLIFCRSSREALLIAKAFDDGDVGYNNVFDDCSNVVAAVTANDDQLDALEAKE